MKIVILTMGSRGDVQPFLSLAQELRARDPVRVVTVCTRQFCACKEAACSL